MLEETYHVLPDRASHGRWAGAGTGTALLANVRYAGAMMGTKAGAGSTQD